MKTIVFAYHDIGCIGLRSVFESKFKVEAVFTHKNDKNENCFFSSVFDLSSKLKLQTFFPKNVNSSIWIKKIKKIKPDFIFSFYYRKILSEELLKLAKIGRFNLHGSLLPKYRGRSPLNWVILNGEKETGVTFHEMISKVDSGNIIAQKKIPVTDFDTAYTLHKKIKKISWELLKSVLPLIKSGKYVSKPQNEEEATYFGKRKPEDSLINWFQSADKINNLIRATTSPYCGAYTFFKKNKMIIWSAQVFNKRHSYFPGKIISHNPLKVACGKNILEILSYQPKIEKYINEKEFYFQSKDVNSLNLNLNKVSLLKKKKKILIFGVNGFIGYHLTKYLLKSNNYDVYGLDINSFRVRDIIEKEKNKARKNFYFFKCDISVDVNLVKYYIQKCDIILPLSAIATPIEYINNPLKVFKLDFEENLKIIRYCVRYDKRIVFPSSSEVYGMCNDKKFNEDFSNFIVGPINKHRWIYSVSKQLLDRIIWSYGVKNNLQFTLFRPFNWIGPHLDTLKSASLGKSRLVTQLILNLIKGSKIKLVDGGFQKRCFTNVQDGVCALFKIIENKKNNCNRKIINIGNPNNNLSVFDFSRILVKCFNRHPLKKFFPSFSGFKNVNSIDYYGIGYQDIKYRIPDIENAKKFLDWIPIFGIKQTIKETLNFFLNNVVKENKKNEF